MPTPLVRPPAALDTTSLLAGVAALADVDADLAGIVARHGPPPLWDRPADFRSLCLIILEQQVSLRSAEAAMGRLLAAAGSVTPEAIRATGETRLLAAGLTRQKTRYLLGLAEDVLDGRLHLGELAALDDETVRERLTAVVGIGRWTADIWLVMALGRPDVWPLGDLALASSMRRAKGLAAIPDAAKQLAIAEPWRPWRAVAARTLWHAYLAGER
jgi:DNA-3-methyladenine glycosylase II